MSSTTKKSSGKGVIGYFRYGINFIERFFRNITSQVKWLFETSKSIHKSSTDFYTSQFGNPPNVVLSVIIGIVIAILAFWLFLFLVVWAGLKAI